MGRCIADLADLVGLAGFSGLWINGDALVVGGYVEGFGGGGHGATIAKDANSTGTWGFFFPKDGAIVGVDAVDSFIAGDKEAAVFPQWGN